ncbi:MAG: hypothetical protein HON70_47725, partial [Lentisphaerae bacterium]|nr:hypothetical protein [Lentisphaerota bacterium]
MRPTCYENAKARTVARHGQLLPILCCIVLCCLPLRAQADSRLTAGTYDVSVGETLTVTVGLESPGLFSMVFAISFDSDILRFMPDSVNWNTGRVSASGDNLNVVLNEDGDQLSFAAIVLGAYPSNIAVAGGNGTVVSFQFEALNPGTTNLAFSGVNLGNAELGVAEQVALIPGTVAVRELAWGISFKAYATELPGIELGVSQEGTEFFDDDIDLLTSDAGHSPRMYLVSMDGSGTELARDVRSLTDDSGWLLVVETADKPMGLGWTDSGGAVDRLLLWEASMVEEKPRLIAGTAKDMGTAISATVPANAVQYFMICPWLEFQLELQQDWNLISSPLEPMSRITRDMFGPVGDTRDNSAVDCSRIWTWDAAKAAYRAVQEINPASGHWVSAWEVGPVV